MRIRPFQYHKSSSVPEALAILAEYGSDIKVLAGGTDLVLALKAKTIRPARVLNISDISDLEYIRSTDDEIRIGALTRHARLNSDTIINEHAPDLAYAAGRIGSWQLRNIGTIGGNLCNGSPSADSAPPLLAADAEVVLADSGGEEQVPLTEFFLGPRSTSLKPNQLMREIVIPLSHGRSYGVYTKIMRKKAVDLALVGVCFRAELDPDGKVLTKVSVALGGVAPTPIRVSDAESMLVGADMNHAKGMLPDVARAAVAAARPISDVRATAEYRQKMVQVCVQRAGEQVIEHLFGEAGTQ